MTEQIVVEPGELSTLIQGAIALAYSIDKTEDDVAVELLTKALEGVVYLLNPPRGELYVIEGGLSDTSSN